MNEHEITLVLENTRVLFSRLTKHTILFGLYTRNSFFFGWPLGNSSERRICAGAFAVGCIVSKRQMWTENLEPPAPDFTQISLTKRLSTGMQGIQQVFFQSPARWRFAAHHLVFAIILYPQLATNLKTLAHNNPTPAPQKAAARDEKTSTTNENATNVCHAPVKPCFTVMQAKRVSEGDQMDQTKCEEKGIPA